MALPHFGSPLLSLVPSPVNVVSAACERADNKALKTAILAPNVASFLLRLEVYNSALVRPTFYPCLAAGKLSKEVGGEPLPSFLPYGPFDAQNRKVASSSPPSSVP